MGRHVSSVNINSDLLNECLKDKCLSKTELARRIGYSREAVTKSINRGVMDVVMLDLIAWHLGKDDNYFREVTA